MQVQVQGILCAGFGLNKGYLLICDLRHDK